MRVTGAAWGHRALSRGIFPVIVVVAGVLAVGWAPSNQPLSPGPGTGGDALRYAVVIGTTYLVLAVLEWWLPYRAEWRGGQRDVSTDVAHFLFTAVPANEVVKVAINLVVLAAAGWGFSGFGLGIWPVG